VPPVTLAAPNWVRRHWEPARALSRLAAMNRLELLLVAAGAGALLAPLVPAPRRLRRWTALAPLLAGPVAAAHLLAEGARPLMLPVYLVVAALLTRSLIRRGRPTPAAPVTGARRALGIGGGVLGLALLSLPVVLSPVVPAPADLSRLGWSAAFAATHARLSREYAFGARKGIDWAGLHARYAPAVAAAEAGHDLRAYYLALRAYAFSLPDGHVGLSGADGSFGMSGGRIRLPGGYTLHDPIGRSLDAAHRVQLDTDAELRGGVEPDVRVPWTEEAARRTFVEGQDVVLDAAVRFLQGQEGR
jgi:hypothetical protein